MTYEAETAAIHRLDALRLRAETTGAEADWQAYLAELAQVQQAMVFIPSEQEAA